VSEDELRRLDDELGRLARTRGARVVGWCCVGVWNAYVLWRLITAT